MRLLHFDELGKLVLTDFDGKTTPPYAILSHRWNDSEIFIQDIAEGAYKERQDGLKKLEFCAKQAAQDGLEYFWIDTCCIDKWNLHELSRAINLMFQWYKNAAHCYVFLSDVSTETPQCNDWEVSFRASAWFKRGWTLQELIAPASVKFFSCEGQCIGDKTSLGELIHDITDIPLAALRDCSLGDFTTSERMRWVESRRTKEEEDIVYCLLGILGVSMPVVYGEGRESAQRRLQAELEAIGNAPSVIPFSQNLGFVGRDSQLAEVEAKLFCNEQTTTTLAIVGLGGTGKSQLALEVAHRTRQKVRNCSVFWIDASDKDRLYQSYASVAQKLNVTGWDDDHADMERVVQDCVAELSAQQCLLIFDNAEATTLQSGGPSNTGTVDLADCLPQSRLCSAIFTTTNSDTADALASQNIITLQELAPAMALKMLTDRLARPSSNAELQEAEHLLKELLYLPLAISQAVACMNASSMTVQDYISQLGGLKKTGAERSDNSSESKLQDSDERNPVATTLSISLNQINLNNKLAADYLFLIACVDWKDIPIDLFEAGSTQSREDAIKVLERYALVTRRPADSALDIHRLVHQALRGWLEVQGRLGEWTQRTIAQLHRIYPNADHSNRSKWRRLFPHAQYALSHGPITDEKERLELIWQCTATLHHDGRYKEYEELEMQGVQISTRVYGEEHHDTLIAKTNLALAYLQQCRWEEAEELEAQTLQLHKRVHGDKHPETFISMANLASVYVEQGRLKEAEELEVQVLEGRKEVFGDEHASTYFSMSNLAATYRHQGRWKEAEELHMQALQGRKRVLGEEHPDTLYSMYLVAVVWHSLDRQDQAFALLEKCLQLRQRILGNQHPETQETLELLRKWRV